jgi:hypothetical protein
LDRINQQIARRTWQPPTKDEPADVEPETETLMLTASRWWQRRKPQLAETTRADYEWRRSHMLTTLRDGVTSEIDVQRIDDFRDELVARGLAARSVNMILDVLAQILDDARRVQADGGQSGARPQTSREGHQACARFSRA